MQLVTTGVIVDFFVKFHLSHDLSDGFWIENDILLGQGVFIQVLNSITELENASTKSKEQAGDSKLEIDLAKVEPLIQELAEFLKDDDTEVAGVLEQLKELLRGSEYSEKLEKLDDLIGQYDFETALDDLKTMAAKLKLSLD